MRILFVVVGRLLYTTTSFRLALLAVFWCLGLFWVAFQMCKLLQAALATSKEKSGVPKSQHKPKTPKLYSTIKRQKTLRKPQCLTVKFPKSF
jgi:hypothetical protein